MTLVVTKKNIGAKKRNIFSFFSGTFAGGNGISEICKVGFGEQTEN